MQFDTKDAISRSGDVTLYLHGQILLPRRPEVNPAILHFLLTCACGQDSRT